MDVASVASWQPTRALGRAVLVTGVLLLTGVVLGRLDLVALAAPFALGTAWALRRRPTELPTLELTLPDDDATEGGSVHTLVRVGNPGRVGFDVAVIRLAYSPWLSFPRGDRPQAIDLGPDQVAEMPRPGVALRWGQQSIGPASAYASAGHGLLVSMPVLTPPSPVRVHPQTPPFRADQVMPRSSALVGVHRSRRPGEGGELAGVRRFGPGDRLRRVDWRVTLRTRELHVAHTLSDRDAEVMIVLDVLREAGRSGGIFGAASVVDTTVRAAAAIAEHYLRQGDRVGLLEFGESLRLLRAASGRRHLQTVLAWLLRTQAGSNQSQPRESGLEPQHIPGSAVVVVLTPMLDPAGVEMIATLARAGRVVVAVDTLGELADRPLLSSQWTALAQRLWRLERAATIGQLREVGVPVTAWAGAGSLDLVLRDMAQLAAAPRMSLR
ncbi:MAG TPA: DUF58 domain-containing protein [Micromonosporaceae bacterium]